MAQDEASAAPSITPAAPDPPPFEVANEYAQSRSVLLCDHAGAAVPRSHGTLGLDDATLCRHIAWDIGAADVTRRLANLLDAPALLANYSRLFIDPNRRLDHPGSILAMSDGIRVPGNTSVDATEAARRADYAFWPYHNRALEMIEQAETWCDAATILCIHSFTPVMEGVDRPWHVGILWNHDGRIARPLLDALRQMPGLVVGDNKPYSGDDPPGYGLDVYGTAAGRPHVTIEIRQDLIDTQSGADEWAEIVAAALRGLLADDRLYRVERFAP